MSRSKLSIALTFDQDIYVYTSALRLLALRELLFTLTCTLSTQKITLNSKINFNSKESF